MNKAEVLQLIGNIRSIRVLARDMGTSEFLILSEKFATVANEKIEEDRVLKESQEKKERVMEQQLVVLESQGVALEELAEFAKRHKKKKLVAGKKSNPLTTTKYECEEHDSREHGQESVEFQDFCKN